LRWRAKKPKLARMGIAGIQVPLLGEFARL
jgi:hypothetical protein